MDSVKHGWRTVITGAVLGLLAAGTASSHVSVVERELRGKAFLNQTSALRGVDHRIALADGGQLVLAASGDTLTLGDRHGRSRAFPLLKTRINASLTLLPSGRVLIWGGSDASGAVQKGGLWFHPDKGEWQAADDLTPAARVGHTATVLGDGRVLFAGGLDRRPAELWDERVNRAVALSGDAVVPRLGHRAELQNDGGVRISGGHEVGGGSSVNDLAFDPLAGSFAAARTERAANGIARSWPQQGASEVMPDARLSVLFADALRMPDLNGATISLVGPGGPTRVQVAPVEGGRMVFVQPLQALFPASKYTLMIDKVHTESGRALPLMAVDFTTAALDAQGRPLPIAADTGAADSDKRITGAGEHCRQGDTLLPCREHGIVEDAVWSPGRDNTDNRWRLYGKSIEADTNPRIAHIARLYDLTVLRGRIVRIDQKPVADVEVSIGRAVARTDQDGRFNLFDVPAGQQELYVDGSTANRGADEYGQFVVGVKVKARQLNELPYLMHLPKIAARDKVRIASPLRKDLVVGHPDIPGLELHIPKGTVIHDRKGRLVTELAIVPTPVNRAPFPVMENHPMAFTVEPGAAQIRGLSPTAQNGIRLYYPNYDGYTAGTEANFWIYDPSEGWRVYGKGTVSADGQHVVPESGVALHQTMGGMYSVPQDNGATESYAPGQSGDCNCEGGEKGDDQAANAGDPIDLKTGEFLHSEVDVAIDDIVPMMIGRSYRPNDLKRREFGIGTRWNWGYTLNLPNTNYNVLELIQPNGTAIRFDRVSGTGNQGEWRQVGSDSRFTGAMLRTVYDSDPTQPWGRAYRITMRDGSRLQFSSWNDIRLRWIEDRYGNRTTVVYDAGLMIKLVSPSGRYLNIGYDNFNRIQEVRDHTGRKWSYVYDVNGLLATVTYPDNKSKHYDYQIRLQSGSVAHHRIESISDVRGNRLLLNEFELVGGASTGRVVRQVRADGSFIAINYAHNDGATIGTLVSEADGSQRRIVFDATSPYPKKETFAYGTPLAQTFSYERNGYGQLTATVDPLQRRTKFEYNAAGQPTKVTALDGTAKARSITMEYYADGDLAATVDSLNRRTQFDYVNRCLVKVTDPLGRSVSLTCNVAGKPIRIDDALDNSTVLEYDGFELAKVTDAMGHSVRYRYDALGRRISTEDARGNVARVEYDVMGLVKKRIDPLGRVTEYGYDDNGNLIAVLLPNGNGLTYTYDERDRPKTRTDALNQVTSWEYYPGDLVKTVKDRNGQITRFAYDALGRTLVKTYPDGTTATSTYDAGDRLRSLVDSSAGDMSWNYDEFDQLKRIDTAQGSIVYEHDGAGRRSEMTVLGQPKVEYDYENGDRLRRIAQGGEAVLFDYDDLGRPTRTTLPNGIKTDYSYNASHQVTAISWLKPNGTPLGDLNYGYDDQGRLVAQTGSYASQTLAPATVASHTFDDNNRQVTRAGLTQSFDPNGSLTDDGARTYVWNARGQLSRIEQGGATIGSFQYDPVGRRVSRVEGGETTTYLYDGANAVQETRGGTVNSVLTGTRVDQRYARSEASGRVYYLTDHLGSTRALTNASGGVVQRYDYAAYGQDSQTAAGSSNPYLYTGREKDLSGLYFYRARYYDPGVARFISEDSYGLAGGDNFYAYVGGNPMERNDPSGHIIPLLVIAGALWTGLELGLSIYDAVDTYNTVMNPCYSNLRKGIAIVLFAAGLILPGTWGWVDNALARLGKTAGRGAGRARHYTDLDGLRGIEKDMAINWSRPAPNVDVNGVHFEVGPFGPLSNAGSDVGAAKYVDGVYVEFDLPEGWIATNAGAAGRTTGVIPSGSTFPISDLNPVFVNAWWARLW